jgi:protein involved in sex pheromone biosynthesis
VVNYPETIHPETKLSVFNSQGKEIFSHKLNTTQTTLDINNLPLGIYLIKISDESKTVSGKFVKK